MPIRAPSFALSVAAALLVGSSACESSPPSPAPLLELPALDGGDGGEGGGDAESSSDGGGPVDLELRFDDGFVRAVRLRAGRGLVVVLERPVHLHDRMGLPDRTLVYVDLHGNETARVVPPRERVLLDVAVHASGEATVLEASETGYYLVRLDTAGVRFAEDLLDDPAIATDPPALHDGESTSRIELHTHDTGRLTADGEGIALAARTGRHSVVAYHVGFEPRAGFVIRNRTLVVPAYSTLPTGLAGGSYDTFAQLDAHYGVHVARDASGVLYVGVQFARDNPSSVVRALEHVFGEPLPADPDGRDAFVTRVTPDGRRLGVSVVGTPEEDQLYGLRARRDGVWAVGRSELWNAQGTGWDALIGAVDANGEVTVRRFDVEQGDIVFDVVPVGPDDLVLGAHGYWQNPSGASISEEAKTLASVLGRNGRLGPVAVPSGPRHSQARSAVALGDGRFLIGGMLDGPGTHSADGDRSRLRARGFVTTRSIR